MTSICPSDARSTPIHVGQRRARFSVKRSVHRFLLLGLGCLACLMARADELAKEFRDPSASASPGVYWYFMDGNLSREGMTRDLEAMKAAGLGRLIFLEVNVGVPRGSIDFLSDKWQEL